MLAKLSASATLVALAYLCENPLLVADPGLRADLTGKRWLMPFYRHLYRTTAGCYSVMHRREPHTYADQLARFQWIEEYRDAEISLEIQTILSEIMLLQAKAVEAEDEQFAAMPFAVFREPRDWHDLGFQGTNPSTDFRGSGKLGLLLFHDFCTNHSLDCRRLADESHSSTSENQNGPWYPLALVSIRLGVAVRELLKREKVLLYALIITKNWFETLCTLHAVLLVQFHEQWVAGVESSKITNYFENELVLKEFERALPLTVYRNLQATTRHQ